MPEASPTIEALIRLSQYPEYSAIGDVFESIQNNATLAIANNYEVDQNVALLQGLFRLIQTMNALMLPAPEEDEFSPEESPLDSDAFTVLDGGPDGDNPEDEDDE